MSHFTVTNRTNGFVPFQLTGKFAKPKSAYTISDLVQLTGLVIGAHHNWSEENGIILPVQISQCYFSAGKGPFNAPITEPGFVVSGNITIDSLGNFNPEKELAKLISLADYIGSRLELLGMQIQFHKSLLTLRHQPEPKS